ncbi:MAG: apolipoprotein N-acyltransferase [Burkholderiales bacterium]|nr:apolipoprotein N-acyltransferase [Burkholderiales bacterium]
MSTRHPTPLALAGLLIPALLAGAASTLSLAPFQWWWAQAATLTLLFLLWAGRSARVRAALGFAFGLGWFGSAVSWVYVSMHEYGAMPMPLAAAATLLFAAYLALWPALAGWLSARLGAGAPDWFVIPAAWCLAEWLRGWMFTGFPWAALGYAHTDGPLSGFAPLIGVHGINLVAALIAALLARALARQHAAAGRIRALSAAALVCAAGHALQPTEWTQHAGPLLKVALMQGNIPQQLKFEEGRFEATLDAYRLLVEAHPATLVVLPETALPRMLLAIPQGYLAQLSELMRRRGADLIVGVPRAETRTRYFNSAISLGASEPQRYDKVHLVPFGEFIPTGFRWFVDLMRIPLGDFTAGDHDAQPLAVAGQRVAVNICYEDLFGEEIIRQAPRATILANMSNIAWFGDSLAPHQHLQISRMRSLETGRPMLRATNTGYTAIVDHRGRVTHSLPLFTPGALVAEVQPTQGMTPYMRYGNWPVVSLTVLALLACAVRAFSSRGRSPA